MKVSIILSIVLFLFALLTLFMSGSVIFDLFGIREKEGNYVFFIVVTNFMAGLLYLSGAYGLLTGKPWTSRLLFFVAAALSVAFIGLLIHIRLGGIYEVQTVKAMGFRIGITTLFAGLASRYTRKASLPLGR